MARQKSALKLIYTNPNIVPSSQQTFYWLYLTPDTEKIMFDPEVRKLYKFECARKLCIRLKAYKLAIEIKMLRNNYTQKRFDEVQKNFKQLLQQLQQGEVEND